ncbi:capsid morphogenesis related protein [Vibrio phage Athena1]|nr:capsid morphogenesis related protein [Vibrio phage Athena1]
MAEEEKIESVKAPTPAKTEERELEDAMESMIELMSRMYRNQVIKELNQGTIEKFEDAQAGNYSVVLTNLAKRLQRKLMSRFSNNRIDEMSKQILAKSDRRSKKIFYQHVSKSIGVDPTTLLKKDGMTYDFNALVLETSQWAKKLRDETLEMYTANTLRAMTLGESIESILEQYDGLVEKRKNHAKFTARNQIASFNSIMNKTRAQKLGIKKAIWVTSKDERVRKSHQWRDGKEFDLDKGLYSSLDGQWLLPGTDYQCRCSYRMILEDEE